MQNAELTPLSTALTSPLKRGNLKIADFVRGVQFYILFCLLAGTVGDVGPCAYLTVSSAILRFTLCILHLIIDIGDILLYNIMENTVSRHSPNTKQQEM